MVKLLDPFSGYFLAYGNFLLHIGYFIALLQIPKNETCKQADYELSWKLLLSSHIIVFVLQIMQFWINKTKHIIISHTLNWISLFFYQGSIFYTQAQYFSIGNECDESAKNIQNWFFIEIVTFYGLIGSAMLFLIIASIF